MDIVTVEIINDGEVEQLSYDIEKSEDARKFVDDFKHYLGKDAKAVIMQSGKEIEFANMSDQDAIALASGIVVLLQKSNEEELGNMETSKTIH